MFSKGERVVGRKGEAVVLVAEAMSFIPAMEKA